MLNTNKRIVKMFSGVLAAVMLHAAFIPTAAFAAHHHAPPSPRHVRHHAPPPPRHVHHYAPLPPRYVHHRHDRNHNRWTKHDTAAVAGLAAVIGLLAVANHNQRSEIPPSNPMSYAEYRDKFANGLNAPERSVYYKLIGCPAGEYKTAYTRPETLKLVLKFCKRLPYDFQFVDTRVVTMEDGSTKSYIYFNRL